MFLFYSTNFDQAFEMFKIQNFGQQQQKCVNQSKGWNTSLGFGQMCRQKWKLTTSELNDSDKRKSETSCGPRVACPAPMPRSGAHGFRPWQGRGSMQSKGRRQGPTVSLPAAGQGWEWTHGSEAGGARSAVRLADRFSGSGHRRLTFS